MFYVKKNVPIGLYIFATYLQTTRTVGIIENKLSYIFFGYSNEHCQATFTDG